MPTYKISIEYALAFDLDLTIEAKDRATALGIGNEAANDAGLWSAIRERFAAYSPEYAGGEVEVTDVRVERTLRPTGAGAK